MSRPAAPLPQALRPLQEVGRGEVRPQRVDDPHRQRDRLLRAATSLFGERGYRHVTTNDLAADAGLSLGTVYSFFDDKRDCLLAAYDLIVEEARGRIAARIPAGLPRRPLVEAAIAALLDEIAADPAAARLVFVVAQTAGAEGAARHRRTLATAGAALRVKGAADLPDGFEDVAVAAAAFLLTSSLLEGMPDTSSLQAELRALLLPAPTRGDLGPGPALAASGHQGR
jgi:AcrR family transcriptional regulator